MISKTKAVMELFEWALFLAKLAITGIFLFALVVLWHFFFGFKSTEFTQVALTSSAESDLVVTSFAQVDLLSLAHGQREILIPSAETIANYDQVVNEEFGKAERFCLQSYEVVFGYKSLATEHDRKPSADRPPVPEPAIVAINTLRSENAPDSSTVWCQQKNLLTHREDLRRQLRFAMEFDQVLHEHLTHGQLMLASLLDLGNGHCREHSGGDVNVNEPAASGQGCLADALVAYWKKTAEESRADAEKLDHGEIAQLLTSVQDAGDDDKLLSSRRENLKQLQVESLSLKSRAAAQERAAAQGVDVASLVLTFSSTLGISQERKRFMGLFTSKRFYLQRDIARVYYGTQLSPTSIHTTWHLFRPDTVRLEFMQPDIIAIDRYTSFVASRNKIDKASSAKESLSSYLNQQLSANLEQGILRFHGRAVRTAETILIDRVPQYFNLEGSEYEIKFQRRGSETPNLSFLPGVLDLEPSKSSD